LDRRKQVDANFSPPAIVGVLSWLFLDPRRRGFFGKIVTKSLGVKEPRPKEAASATRTN
jgi:hypothetical protein